MGVEPWIAVSWIIISFLLLPSYRDIFKAVWSIWHNPWQQKPTWTVEYFGRTTKNRMMTVEEIMKKYNNHHMSFAQHMYGTEYVKEEVWGFREFETSSTFHSEQEALRAFKRSSTLQEVPYVQYRAICTFPGISKQAARQDALKEEQKALEKAQQAKVQYRERYTEFLEKELNKMKELTE